MKHPNPMDVMGPDTVWTKMSPEEITAQLNHPGGFVYVSPSELVTDAQKIAYLEQTVAELTSQLAEANQKLKQFNQLS